MGAWLVEGIYTYSRNSVLKNAGIRGSHPAMPIERAGALNRVQGEVTRLLDVGGAALLARFNMRENVCFAVWPTGARERSNRPTVRPYPLHAIL